MATHPSSPSRFSTTTRAELGGETGPRRRRLRLPTVGEFAGATAVALAVAAIATPNGNRSAGSSESSPAAVSNLGAQIETLAAKQQAAEAKGGSLPNVVLADNNAGKNAKQRHLLMKGPGGQRFDIVLAGGLTDPSSSAGTIDRLSIDRVASDGERSTVFSAPNASDPLTFEGNIAQAQAVLESLGGGAPGATAPPNSLQITLP